MRLLVFLLIVIMCIGSGKSSFADEKVITKGFVTCNAYRDFSQQQKQIYITGLIDGVLSSSLIGLSNSNVIKFMDCTKGIEGKQLIAIFDKFIDGSPGVWHYSANLMFILSLKDSVCKNID